MATKKLKLYPKKTIITIEVTLFLLSIVISFFYVGVYIFIIGFRIMFFTGHAPNSTTSTHAFWFFVLIPLFLAVMRMLMLFDSLRNIKEATYHFLLTPSFFIVSAIIGSIYFWFLTAHPY